MASKNKVDLRVLSCAVSFWHNVYAQFAHAPCSLVGRDGYEGKTYYYLEPALGPAGREWITNLYNDIGGNTSDWCHFLMSTTPYTPNLVCAMILEQLLKTTTITDLRGRDEVTAVKVVLVQMKPEHYHPAVECYCDPSISPSDVPAVAVGPDPLRLQTDVERAHCIVSLQTRDGRAFAFDASSPQHRIPLIVKATQMPEYLRQFTTGSILEEHPASAIVGDYRLLYDASWLPDEGRTGNDEAYAVFSAQLLADSTRMPPQMVPTLAAVCAGLVVFNRMQLVLSRHGNEKKEVLTAFDEDFRAENEGWGIHDGDIMIMSLSARSQPQPLGPVSEQAENSEPPPTPQDCERQQLPPSTDEGDEPTEVDEGDEPPTEVDEGDEPTEAEAGEEGEEKGGAEEGEEGEEKAGEEAGGGETSPTGLFFIKRLHGAPRKGKRGQEYLVEWKGSAERSWEPVTKIRWCDKGALLRHQDWLKRSKTDPSAPYYLSGQRHHGKAGSNANNSCVVVALQVAASLYGDFEYASDASIFQPFLERSPDGLDWSDTQKLCDTFNDNAFLREKQEYSIGSRATNMINTRQTGLGDIQLPDGVFIASAFNYSAISIGHCFVIQVVEGRRLVHDPEVDSEPFEFTKEKLHWIRRWNYIQAFEKKASPSTDRERQLRTERIEMRRILLQHGGAIHKKPREGKGVPNAKRRRRYMKWQATQAQNAAAAPASSSST